MFAPIMKLLKCLLAVLFMPVVSAIMTPPEEDYYHAAVVEYMPVKGVDADDTLTKNVVSYVKIIAEAAKKADIVVFPEGGLNNGDLTLFTEVPFEESKAIAVDDTLTIHNAIRKLSNAAKENNIYVAINIHEAKTYDNETLKYNTNVVFDRNGSIIARYRKYNIYSEKVLNITKKPEHIYFDADFGVRFGTFTCFDILFQEPSLTLVQKYNVTDIIFTSWWFSELPFLTAVQEQGSWSYASNANLLASGVNSIQRGSTGSGIYAGNRGPVVYLLSLQSGTRLLTAKLYKEGRKGLSTGNITDIKLNPLPNESLIIKKEYLEDYLSQLLLSDVPLKKVNNSENERGYHFIQDSFIEKELCQSDFCCKFEISMTSTYKVDDFPIKKEKSYYLEDSFYHYRYRIVIFNGVRSFDNFATGGSQVCGIIPCLNDTYASCGFKTGNVTPVVIDTHDNGPLYLYSTIFHNITIKTTSIASDSFTFPHFMESSKIENKFGSIDNLASIYFYVNGSFAKFSFSSSKLVSGAIYNRVYSRDGNPPGVSPSSANSYPPSSLLLYIMLLLIFSKLLVNIA